MSFASPQPPGTRGASLAIQLYDLAGKDPAILFSPFSWRVRMALLHTALPFAVVPWRFSDRLASAASGFETVPVIKDGDHWVGDSWEIALYLDRRYPDAPPLMKDAESRAAARLVMALCGVLVFPAAIRIAVYQAYLILDERCQPYFRKSREAMFGTTLESLNVDAEVGKNALQRALEPFSETIENSPFLGGDMPSYADFSLFGVLKWADIVSSYRPLEHDTVMGQWFTRIGALYGGHAGSVPTVRG